MLRKIAVKLAVKLLDKSSLSIEDRNSLTSAILDKFAGLPLRDIIMVREDNSILVNGKPVELDHAIQLRESARNVLHSQAFRLIRDQVLFHAITTGVHRAEKPETMLFGKASIWWGQQETRLLELLAAEHEGNSDLNGN